MATTIQVTYELRYSARGSNKTDYVAFDDQAPAITCRYALTTAGYKAHVARVRHGKVHGGSTDVEKVS